jgi:hypothetical protein
MRVRLHGDIVYLKLGGQNCRRLVQCARGRVCVVLLLCVHMSAARLMKEEEVNSSTLMLRHYSSALINVGSGRELFSAWPARLDPTCILRERGAATERLLTLRGQVVAGQTWCSTYWPHPHYISDTSSGTSAPSSLYLSLTHTLCLYAPFFLGFFFEP